MQREGRNDEEGHSERSDRSTDILYGRDMYFETNIPE